MIRFLWLCLLLSCSKILESSILNAFSTSTKFNFICALLCVAKPSRTLIKEVTKCRGSDLQRKMGSGITFDEIETDIRTCFAMHFVVSVSLYVSSFTQIESKSKNFQTTFDPICMEYWTIPTSKRVFVLTGKHYSGKCAWLARYR